MAPRGTERAAELQELLSRHWPEIVELLRLYQVPPARAEEIVHDTVVALAVRWERVAHKGIWLLSTVENRCRMRVDPQKLGGDGASAEEGSRAAEEDA
jgi:DNA-directed RNA polymerase specialized sigma24 family protein